MLLIALTISEAASILGISPSASKAEINTAYRDAITKYHPDANRSKSPGEQKQAEQMFKQVAAARKVMLNPATAEPEPVSFDMPTGASPQSGEARPTSNAASNADRMRAHQAQQPRQSTQPRPQQSYHASASSSQYVPQGHNTARSFNDDVPKVVDSAEEQLANIYRSETREEYLSFSDKARLTPSWAVSIVFLVVSFAMFFMVPFSFENISLANPCLILAIVCLVKLVIYDTFISYYLFRAVKKIMRGAWGVLCGAECLILGIVGAVLTAGSAIAPAVAPAIFGGLAGVGVVICGLSVVLSRVKK